MTVVCRNDRSLGDPPPYESQGGESEIPFIYSKFRQSRPFLHLPLVISPPYQPLQVPSAFKMISIAVALFLQSQSHSQYVSHHLLQSRKAYPLH
jgi:hypothetical protein